MIPERLRSILYLVSAAPFLLMLSSVYSADNDIYCGINAVSYLAGDYAPSENICFADPYDSGIPTKFRKHYLRKETVRSLEKMYKRFRAENPGIPFFVRSSTRTYKDQFAIWNNKWTKEISSGKIPAAAVSSMLRYSAMPGTSRHHWGTDFDLNELNNAYYEKGDGRVLYDWMVKNAPQYGFCMPYGPGRKKGYAEERWHWSYRPLADIFLLQWNFSYADDPKFFFRAGRFSGLSSAAGAAPVYVNAVSGGCL
jgi:LAS superfamily LD-carboxypeptidase LdcB